MRIVSLSLRGYRQFLDETTVEMPLGLIGISGPNGVGKSKLIESIGYGLYAHRKVLPSSDFLADVHSFMAPKGTTARVELQFELSNQFYEVVRAAGGKTCIRLHGSDTCLASGTRAVTDKVVELLNLSPAAFLSTCVARQKEVAGLQTLTPADRQKVVNRLIGVTATEKAISFAEQERSNKQSLWQAADSVAQGRVEKAEQQLQERQAELEHALKEEKQQETAETAANHHRAEAESEVRTLHDQLVHLKGYVAQLNLLNGHIGSLELSRDNAKRSIREGQAAIRQHAEAKRVLSATKGAQERLEWQEQLAEREALFVELKEADRNLSHIGSLDEQRRELKESIVEDETILCGLRGQHSTCIAEHSRLDSETRVAHREVEKHRQRHKKAQELGESGECEICGQNFGAQWKESLARHKRAERGAQGQKDDCDKRLKDVQEKKQAIESQIEQRISLLETKKQEFNDLHYVPSRVSSCLKEVESLEKRFSEVSAPLTGDSFNWYVWEEACESAEAHMQAAQQLDVLRPQIYKIDELRPVLQSAEEELTKKQDEKSAMEAHLVEAPVVEAALRKAETVLDQARDACQTAQKAARTASQNVSRVKAQIESAESALKSAREAQGKANATQRTFLVAKRTEDLLREVRSEILVEAKPRIAELIENWASSLLSPNFKSIELTDDYRIQADLGSGVKHLDHFSGGEQTLLSVMLRVAIAIFCQERAGFETGFLVLDEVFGDQDTVRRTQLVEFLQEIKQHFHQILIVNHIEAVTDMLDSVIEISATGPKTSQASFRK